MPLIDTRQPNFKKNRKVTFNWDNWRGGLNTLLKDSEIKSNELSQADNIVLTGKGVPTKRWGYTLDFLSNATGSVRGLSGYYLSDGTNELVSITDQGYLTIKNGSSYTQRSGASWASGYDAWMAQIEDNLYIVNGNREVVRYSTPTLAGFPTLAQVTGVYATPISGTTGDTTYSYRITTVSSSGGETLGTTPISVTSMIQDLSDGALKLFWSGVSAAASAVAGYNIYGRKEGDERFIARVGPDTLTWIDDGSVFPSELTFPPTADTTGGINAKYVIRFQDRLVYANIDGEDDKVVITGKVPNHEKYDVASGGNYIRIEPDAGDDITGIAEFGEKLIVFKRKSIWEIQLTQLAVGNFTVTQPIARLITRSRGCIAPKSIQAVENDLFFLSDDGIYVVGLEPNILGNVLRTNELSARIRPDLAAISQAQLENSTSIYADSKYIISFPGKDQTFVYDRERLGWVGPWTFDARVMHKYYDSSNVQKWLFGADDAPNVYEMSENYRDDDGSAIATTIRTRNEDFGDWTLFKYIFNMFSNWRMVQGTVSVDVQIEGRDGAETLAKSFSIAVSEGNSGWGSDIWGTNIWGLTSEDGALTDTEDIVREPILNAAARRIQVTVKTTNRNDDYELISLRAGASPIDRGYTGSDWQV